VRLCRTAGLWLFLLLQLLPAQKKQTLAVIEFEGFGISGPEIQILTNRLRTNMTQLGVYRVIERGLILRILEEQNLQMTGCTSGECIVGVRKLLGTQLILTRSFGKGDREKALAAGCTGYLEKPINTETIMAEIEKYL